MPTKKNPSTSPKSKAKYTWSVGRRKQAIARVRLYPKRNKKTNTGDITVNGKPIQEYFDQPLAKFQYDQPLRLTKSLGRFQVTIKVSGSGVSSQIDAIKHALARALVKVDESFKPELKQHGLLTRDPRKRQRRMIGKGGKSRRQKQSPKR